MGSPVSRESGFSPFPTTHYNKHSWHLFVVSLNQNWHNLAVNFETPALAALRNTSSLATGPRQAWGRDVSWSVLHASMSKESLKLPFPILESQDHPVSSWIRHGSKLHAQTEACHSELAFHWTLGLFYSLWWFLGTVIWGNELWHYLSQSHCHMLLPGRKEPVLGALTPMTPSKICSAAWGESATLSTLPAPSTHCRLPSSLAFYFFLLFVSLLFFFTAKENACRGVRQRRNGMSGKET